MLLRFSPDLPPSLLCQAAAVCVEQSTLQEPGNFCSGLFTASVQSLAVAGGFAHMTLFQKWELERMV